MSIPPLEPTAVMSAIGPSSLVDVDLVSGMTFKVMTHHEKAWFEQTRDTYMEQTKFSETTDLRDLDRLLTFELMIFRWTQWLAAGVDYEGFETDAESVRKNIKEYSDQINKIKESMGLNKRARDDAANDGNLAEYISNLRARAKLFGMHREKQLQVALVLFNELSGIVATFDRGDDEERAKAGFKDEVAIVGWIRAVAMPKFRAVDEHFREHEQRYWIREM